MGNWQIIDKHAALKQSFIAYFTILYNVCCEYYTGLQWYSLLLLHLASGHRDILYFLVPLHHRLGHIINCNYILMVVLNCHIIVSCCCCVAVLLLLRCCFLLFWLQNVVKVKRQIHLYLKLDFSSLHHSYVNSPGYMARTISATNALRHIR